MIPDVIEDIFADTITKKPKATWQREKELSERTNQLGYIFFAEDKNSFDVGTALRTYYTLDLKMTAAIEKLDHSKFEAPFITFNSFAVRKKWKQYLRWLNAISVEIDNPEATLADVIYFCQLFDLPNPSLVIKSPKGIHVHWLIDRVRAHANKLKDYDEVSKALKKAFARLNSDAIGPERYWRMPTNYNILFQTDDRFTLDDLKRWANNTFSGEEQLSKHTNILQSEIPVSKVIITGVMENPAIQRLLKGVPYGLQVRNRTAFTLALLLFRSQGMDRDDVYTYLSEQWNPRNEVPLSMRELQKTVRSACSGRYHTAKAEYINEILQTIGSELRFRYQIRSNYCGQKKYIKRSIMAEKILELVKQEGGSCQLSQRSLASKLQAALKSVQNALQEIKDNGLAMIETKDGRAGGTSIRIVPNEEVGSQDETKIEVKDNNIDLNERKKIIPLPSIDPLNFLRSTISVFGRRGASIKDLHFTYRKKPETLLVMLSRLVKAGEVIEMLEFETKSGISEIELISRFRLTRNINNDLLLDDG